VSVFAARCYASSLTILVADGHVEVVDAFVYLGCIIDYSGGSRGEVLRRIGLARSCMNMLERRIWKSSIRLETKLRLYASFDVWVRDLGHHKVPALSPRCIGHMGTTQDLEDTVYSPCVKVRKSEEPLVVYRFLTWRLIDVCGSSAIQLAVHLARTTIEPLQRVSDKYRPTGSDEQEDLATLGSVQLRQTLALWTLVSRLPRERPLLETNGDILWTQQRSSGVRSERQKRGCYASAALAVMRCLCVCVFVSRSCSWIL